MADNYGEGKKYVFFIDQLIQRKSQLNELGCYAYKSFIESIWRERERDRERERENL